MKKTLGFVLTFALCCTIAFADGNQGNSGYNCPDPNNNCPPDCTQPAPDCPPECTEGCTGGGSTYQNDEGDTGNTGTFEEIFTEAIIETIDLVLM